MNYDEAAKLYRLAKAYVQARRMYEKLVEINQNLNDYWAAARNFEAMITLTIECDDKVAPEELVKLTTQAANYFKLSDSQQNYVSIATKVCKYLEKNGNFSYASDIYELLIKDLEDTENYYIRNETINNYVSLLITMTSFAQVIEIYEKEIDYHRKVTTTKVVNLNQMALALICVYLIVGDIKSADAKLQQFMTSVGGFYKSNEVTAAEKMVDAYIDGNQQEFDSLITKPIITAIFPSNIVKCLRKVTVKASPHLRKVCNVDDILDMNMQVSSNTTADNFGQIEPPPQIPSQIAKTEEEKKKMLEDFVS